MDDFKDLQWTTTPSSSTPRPTSTATNATGARYDAFSMLAAQAARPLPNYLSPAASQPSSRPITPSNAPKPAPAATSTDAFGDLLGFGGGSNGTGKMSIAEQQARAERERRERQAKDRQALQAQSAFWDKLDSGSSKPAAGASDLLGGIAPIKPQPANGTTALRPTPPSSRILSPVPPPSTSPRPQAAAPPVQSPKSSQPPDPSSKKPTTVWDFDLLGSGSSSDPPVKPSGTSDVLDDFDDFLSAPSKPKPPQPAKSKAPMPPEPRSSTPGDFDWGDREYDNDEDDTGLLDAGVDEHEDILGALGKPAQATRPQRRESPPSELPERSSPSNGRSAPPRPRTSSPPPHVLGKLVEMGFSIQQAKVALAATDSGEDVEAAMEILLAQAAVRDEDAGFGDEPSPPRRQPERRPTDERTRRGGARPERPRGDRQLPARRSPRSDEEEEVPQAAFDHIAVQADKVLTQASEFGVNLFNKANAFWKTANKAIEERRSATSTPSQGGGPERSSGAQRPKWMQNAEEEDGESGGPAAVGSFKDSDDEGPEPASRSPPSKSRAAEQARRPQPGPSRAQGREQSLLSLGDEQPTRSYISPHRRKKAEPQAPAARRSTTPLAAPPPPKPSRNYVTCSATVLQVASTHRTAGTEAYKLGQFAKAEEEFSRAINALPDKHMGLVPLWNNRAMSRLKTGDGAGAVSDCSAVLQVVGLEWREGDDPEDSKHPHGAGVNLGEALVKAATRRAMAYEMSEKWDKAREDWEKLAGIGNNWGPAGAKARAEASRGLDRCRKALAPPPPPAAESSKPKPKPAPPRPVVPTAPGEATQRLKAANQAAEAEEAERYRLKDSVDSRLIAWKGGKETNVRALIASLEIVLWPELGWVKVSMADLITEQQVKIRYMKAIAKLHPDKLRNATVEHQMIANGVFGALNEAYNVFKP